MFGLEFPGEEQPKYVFSVDAWKALGTRQFWKGICCHSLERCILMATACGKITTQNTPATQQRNGCKTMVLNTGSHLLNHQLVTKLYHLPHLFITSGCILFHILQSLNYQYVISFMTWSGTVVKSATLASRSSARN